jgi:hypothetical protein
MKERMSEWIKVDYHFLFSLLAFIPLSITVVRIYSLGREIAVRFPHWSLLVINY